MGENGVAHETVLDKSRSTNWRKGFGFSYIFAWIRYSSDSFNSRFILTHCHLRKNLKKLPNAVNWKWKYENGVRLLLLHVKPVPGQFIKFFILPVLFLVIAKVIMKNFLVLYYFIARRKVAVCDHVLISIENISCWIILFFNPF